MNTPVTELRIGIVGLGMMGRNHARVANETEGLTLVGVVDPMGDRFNASQGSTVFDDLQPLLDLGLDMAVVAAPTGDHLEVGLALAGAGVHTMIEKPLADNVESATQLRDAFENAGLIGCVGHIERFNPALQELKRRIKKGQIGEIFQIATRRVGPFPARIRDVGVVKDLASHDLDLTAWVADSPYESVSAQTSHMTGREYEDLVAVTGRLANGIVTNHLVNWLTPLKERLVTVTGTKGAFVADTLTGDLTWFANADVPNEWDAMSVLRGVAEGDMIRYAYPKPEPLKREHEAFRDAILGIRNDVVTMDEGLLVVKTCEDVLESASQVL
jgi:UDP-N-acetylglucosamine 3-dehydrogenase